jgi:hypothetical protein
LSERFGFSTITITQDTSCLPLFVPHYRVQNVPSPSPIISRIELEIQLKYFPKRKIRLVSRSSLGEKIEVFYVHFYGGVCLGHKGS